MPRFLSLQSLREALMPEYTIQYADKHGRWHVPAEYARFDRALTLDEAQEKVDALARRTSLSWRIVKITDTELVS